MEFEYDRIEGNVIYYKNGETTTLPSIPIAKQVARGFSTDPMPLRDDLQHIPMCRPSEGYRPFKYDWAENASIIQQRIHWIPEETTLGNDVRDYEGLEYHEKYLLDNALKLFTQSDIDISDDYMALYLPIFRNGEIKRMLMTFAGMEMVHIRAYALVNDTLGLEDKMYGEFLNIKAMRDKHDLLAGFTMKDEKDIAKTLALVSGFGEGLMLYSSFALMLNYTRNGKMNGLGQILAWSQRDENLHCQGIGKLFNVFCDEAGLSKDEMRDPIMVGCEEVIRLEDNFIDLCFAEGPQKGLTAQDMKDYIRYTADQRLEMLGLPKAYNLQGSDVHDWIVPLVGGVEHANFFETRATEYSKGSTKGTWDQVWDNFDKYNSRKLATT